MNKKMWIEGLESSFVGGISGILGSIVMDADKIGTLDFWKRIALMALVSGIINASIFLKAHPVPNDDSEPPVPPQCPPLTK